MAEPKDAPQEQQVNDSLSLWQLIQLGDSVRLEADLVVEGKTLLSVRRYYEVIGKSSPEDAFHCLYVQSDLTGEVVELFPGFIADYRSPDEPPHQA